MLCPTPACRFTCSRDRGSALTKRQSCVTSILVEKGSAPLERLPAIPGGLSGGGTPGPVAHARIRAHAHAADHAQCIAGMESVSGIPVLSAAEEVTTVRNASNVRSQRKRDATQASAVSLATQARQSATRAGPASQAPDPGTILAIAQAYTVNKDKRQRRSARKRAANAAKAERFTTAQESFSNGLTLIGGADKLRVSARKPKRSKRAQGSLPCSISSSHLSARIRASI